MLDKTVSHYRILEKLGVGPTVDAPANDLSDEPIGVDERIVGRQVRPAGDAEDVLDTLGLQ